MIEREIVVRAFRRHFGKIDPTNAGRVMIDPVAVERVTVAVENDDEDRRRWKLALTRYCVECDPEPRLRFGIAIGRDKENDTNYLWMAWSITGELQKLIELLETVACVKDFTFSDEGGPDLIAGPWEVSK